MGKEPSRHLRTLIFLLVSQPLCSLAELTERQAALLTNNCVQCHVRPNIGVPQMGNPADWKDRVAQGEEKMLANVVYGLRGMPPLGYCSACNEQDFRVMIQVMTGVGEITK